MTIITKTLALAGLALVLLPAGQALASVPRDPGALKLQCLAQGGEFALGAGADVYSCDYLDGSIEICDFAALACDVVDGPQHIRHNTTTVGGPVKVQLQPGVPNLNPANP